MTNTTTPATPDGLASELAVLLERGWDNEIADLVRANGDRILAALTTKADVAAEGVERAKRILADYTKDAEMRVTLALSALIRTPSQANDAASSFQDRVKAWMYECFPATVCNDRLERRDRLVEEALELAQTLPDFTADRAHALVDYVFARPPGVTEQESGGVSVTHAALCVAEGIDQAHWAEAELARINLPETIQKIRAKQAAKPTGSALPIAPQELPDAH